MFIPLRKRIVWLAFERDAILSVLAYMHLVLGEPGSSFIGTLKIGRRYCLVRHSLSQNALSTSELQGGISNC